MKAFGSFAACQMSRSYFDVTGHFVVGLMQASNIVVESGENGRVLKVLRINGLIANFTGV